MPGRCRRLPRRRGDDVAQRRVTAVLAQFCGVDTRNMWGLPAARPLGSGITPTRTSSSLVGNTPRCDFSPATAPTCTHLPCDDRLLRPGAGQLLTLLTCTSSALCGRELGHLDTPASGNHDWSSWGRQLGAHLQRPGRRDQVVFHARPLPPRRPGRGRDRDAGPRRASRSPAYSVGGGFRSR